MGVVSSARINGSGNSAMVGITEVVSSPSSSSELIIYRDINSK